MSPALVETVVRLPADVSAHVLGGKGSTLNRLVELGAPVPPSAVITTELYGSALRDASLREFLRGLTDEEDPDRQIEAIDHAFLAVDVPLGEAVAAGLEVAAGSPLAVRSSATAEDSARASFAGQYRSYLNVEGAEAIERAIRLTWASLWYPAPRAYRRHLGIDDHAIEMAVLLTRQVDAVEAGVVFTLDPLSGSADLRVETVAGLADRFVTGHETPTVRHLTRSGAPTAPAYLETLRTWALKIEAALGLPSDIEWAYDGTALWIVQARPQTALPGDGFDTALPAADAYIAGGIAEMLPGILTPLCWEINSFLIEEALRSLLDDLQRLPDELSDPHEFVQRVLGRARLSVAAMRRAGLDVPGDASSYDAMYAVAPREVTARRKNSVVGDWRAARLRHQARFEAAIAKVAVRDLTLNAPDLDLFSDRVLAGYLARLIDLGARVAAAEASVAATSAAAFERLVRRLGRYTDRDVALDLAQRLTARIQGRDLPRIAAKASASIFAGPTWEELGIAPPTVEAGSTPTEIDLGSLRHSGRWRRDRVFGGYIVDLPQALLNHAVTDAAKWLRAREECKADLFLLGGEARRVLMEIGQRLASRGVLDDAADVELCTMAELRAVLHGSAMDPQTVAARSAAMRRYEPIAAEPTTLVEGGEPGVFTGWGASAGVYRGAARVVRSAAGDGLCDGDVLVARTTDSSWTPLFLRAGAIVVEQGGPLSHAAILARELGRPAVVNVAGVFDHVAARPGYVVEVDGTRGRVVEVGGDRT